MITYKNGDLLESSCDIICHQVNLQGIMGGGLAKQIANKYPNCEMSYKNVLELCKKEDFQIFGRAYLYEYENNRYIANCFTQTENYDTDYEQVRKCFSDIKDFAFEHNNLSIGFPYNYGCGIANGDWNIVEQIIKDIFEDDKIDCQIWRL